MTALITLQISGILVNAANNYPVCGLQVKAYAIVRAPLEGGQRQTELSTEYLIGESASGDDGRFSIIFLETRPVLHQINLLVQRKEAFILKVYSQTGQLYLTSKPLLVSSRFPITLSVPLPARPVSPSIWHEMGVRMEDARLVQINELVRQLVLTSAALSLFGDWDVETRHSIVNELEQAFLDPQGVLPKNEIGFRMLRDPEASARYLERIQPRVKDARGQQAIEEISRKAAGFGGLYEVDWVIDPIEFKQGKPGAGLSKFEEACTAGTGAVTAASVVAVAKVTDLRRYRNYLRTIYTGPTSSSDYAARKKKLESRFHQNFFTNDVSKMPANQILITIVKEILTSSTGGEYGFGLNASQIQPQGDRSKREYLDYLIGLSGLTQNELGLRYRLDFGRQDSSLSSKVEENITTLQRFFSDSHQCAREPFPIIAEVHEGKAPFFLQYEEWLSQNRPFYGENIYQIKRTFNIGIGSDDREYFIESLKTLHDSKLCNEEKRFYTDLTLIAEQVEAGHKAYSLGELKQAYEHYKQAHHLVENLVNYFESRKTKIAKDFDLKAEFLALKGMAIKNDDDLENFISNFVPRQTYYPKIWTTGQGWVNSPDAAYEWITSVRETLILSFLHLALYVLPTCLGDTALALGDYRNAVYCYGRTTRFPIGMAKSGDEAGYRKHYEDAVPLRLYHAGDLPYTANLHKSKFDQYPLSEYDESYYSFIISGTEKLSRELVDKYTPLMEERFLRLRHANSMLEWADSLYRTDDPSNIARARELYKAVLWLHGKTPPINPNWGGMKVFIPPFLHFSENPARTCQATRARIGICQLETGLNYYGCTETLVPALRYRPLKDAANSFAASAKSAQEDFLVYTGNLERLLEETLRENILTTNMLKKAHIQAQIAAEQIKIAQHGVNAAQNQLAQIDDAISAKRKELDKDFWSELVDFIGGMIGAMSGAYGKTSSASSVVGAGGSIYGALIYAGYTSAKSMGNEYEQIANEISALKAARTDALVFLDIKKRELNITSLQHQLAKADAELAMELAAKLGWFRETKLLNIDFWVNLSSLMKRVMRRYLELGAKYAWLAERALSYEQNKPIRIIRFDYFPIQIQNVTGADLLQLDLSELESSYISGIKQTVPVKHTYSLAANFPLQFGQLKKTGRCTFFTQESFFRQAYPGTYGYRIRGVNAVFLGPDLMSLGLVRGMLTNHGISLLSNHDGTTHLSVRAANGLPLSEFRLDNDMSVFGLPDEALMPFEGSGIETFWGLELSSIANPFGLKDMNDVLITFDIRAQYSPELREKDIAADPTTISRFMFMSASKFAPQAIENLCGDASIATIEFNILSLPLPEKETNRKVKNLVVFLVGGEPLNFTAIFSSTTPEIQATIHFEKSIALSNAPPLQTPAPASPLNSFVNQDADQIFKIIIDKSSKPDIEFSALKDVVLGVEYTADYCK